MLCLINHITINNQKNLFGCGGNRIYMQYYVSRTRYRLIDPVHSYLVYMNILTGISTRKPIQYITGHKFSLLFIITEEYRRCLQWNDFYMQEVLLLPPGHDFHLEH